MSLKNSHTTADYIEWSQLTNLILRLYRDKDYKMSLLISIASFCLLRISDVLNMKYEDLMFIEEDGIYKVKNEIILFEKKTKKKRIIPINDNLQKHILDCFENLQGRKKDLTEYIFISAKKSVYSVQAINRKLKLIKAKYGLKISNFSTHTFRKSGARHIFEKHSENNNGQLAIVHLMTILGHSSPEVSLRYIAIRQSEINNTFQFMSF